VFAGGALYQWQGARRDARRLPAPGRLIDIDVTPPSTSPSASHRLHFYALGDGPVTVVFEAGLAASSLNFRAMQEQVAGFARACAYDRAGYGWSDRVGGSRTARVAATDLRALLQAAGVRPPYVLVAHSFGTYVARVFGAEHGSEVVGIILLDPITAEEWVAPDREHRHLLRGGRFVSNLGAGLAAIGVVRFLLNRLMPTEASDADAELRAGSALPGRVLNLLGPNVVVAVRRIVGEVTKMPRTLWPEVQAHWSRTSCFLTMAQHFRALSPSAAEVLAVTPERPRERADARPPLGDIPLVVISAANCSEEHVQRQRGLASLSSRGTHLRAATGGHWIHLDEPSLVLDAIRRLANGLYSRA
jgi:pimeloyl-ACP methyl ester carboxylesterase